MKITIAGAASGEVTGSAYYVQTQTAAVLVDFGLFQGAFERETGLNESPFPGNRQLDAVLLTHAHLDHTGRLPLLAKHGRKVPIFATPATIELTALILRDAARIQASDAARQNRKRQRAGKREVEALYTPEDAETAISLMRPVPYGEPVDVAPGLRAVWKESGHLLGSASIQVLANEGGREKKVVFSGDVGPRNAPILRDFEPFTEADVVFMESTYGDRDHRPFAETVEEFSSIVEEAVAARGRILVPTFAVGRAQLITGLLGWMIRNKRVKPFPLFLDSPMAIEASEIYMKHTELFDADMTRYIEERPLADDLRTLRLCVTADESKQINDQPGPCLVMAGAGMCTAGRILHHFKASLWRPGTHVLIVGYQGRGTLGRELVEGAKSVTIHGDEIVVKAKIHTLGGFSAHAGQTDLLAWYSALAPAKPRVILTHGEDGPRRALAQKLKEIHHVDARLPELGDTVEL